MKKTARKKETKNKKKRREGDEEIEKVNQALNIDTELYYILSRI